MSNNRFRILFALLLTATLALTVLPSTFGVPTSDSSARAEVPIPGVSSYTEDFTTTTYRGAATTATGWGTGAVTKTRDYTVTQLGFYATPAPVYSVDIQGRKAYTTLYNTSTGLQSVRVFNITDLANLEYMSYRSASRLLGAGEVEGDVFYVGSDFLIGSGYCALLAYNVTNPYSIPGPLDSTSFADGNITDLAVQGHFLYVVIHGSSGNDFTIIDVQDPTLMKVIGGSPFSDLYGVDVKGQLAYLADGIYGLYIHNVSNPYSSTLVVGHDTPGNSKDVLVDGTFAYVADGPAGVQIIDVSTPSLPVTVGSYNTPGQALRLALQGHTLFVADGAGGLQVVDVANPAHPCSVTQVALPYTCDVALYGGDVVVATASGIYTLRIGKGVDGLVIMNDYGGGYQYWDVRVRGDIAYVAAGSDGLLTFNVSDYANPVLLDQYDVGGVFRKLDVQGHLVFVADYGSAFRVFDVSDPANIEFTDARGLDYATDVCVAGEVAYIADGPAGVFVYNVSNPYNIPGPITSFGPPTENATALWVQGYHLYVVTSTTDGGGFHIYDIRDISSPTLVFSWPASVDHYDIFVDGDSVYVADRTGYVAYWNVTNPYNAYWTSYYSPSAGQPTGVWGFGPYIVTSVYNYTIALVNATDVENLDLVVANGMHVTGLQVTMHGDYAYVANQSSLVTALVFRSAASTFMMGSSVAESLTVDATSERIVNATLSLTGYFPMYTGITWQLSADSGAHWEAVTPGTPHTFTNTGSDLRWRATFGTGAYRSAYLYGVSITYGHIVDTTVPPIPGFPPTAIAVGAALSLGLILALRRRKPRKQ